MTDTNENAPKPFDMAAAMARYHADRAAYERRSESVHPANKKALFDALASANITQVIVTFDGYGDSGQIEDISALCGGDTVALPKGEITIARVIWGNDEITENTMSVEEAVEQLAYDFLSETHGGWENNDGAYGEFTFDVEEETITLDYNERYTATETYEHTF
ncbi:DUF6878 family protein [Paracoccus onubensis]|uniref:DUF6878 domain-containing protein n=1 Tax=Paracoccus onubensis TaxID=1675788 RepID=A0A418T1T6_9RHOB|nr:DUF6878 family protein [Paracoccus onubensis]RJE87169.1 hypothetical protein D3P04_05335 [Paracoccus onubensis]